ALKLLTKGLGDEQARRRFLRESRAASQLNHRNICTIYDTGERDGQPYLVMELLEGRNLRERMTAGPLEIVEILEIAAQICDALEAANPKAIANGDTKPANIFLAGSVSVKVLDFGLAKIVPEAREETASLTKPGMVLGTTAYMSPEQVHGAEVDGRSDLF